MCKKDLNRLWLMVLTVVLLSACAGQSMASDWGAASNGNVPQGAAPIEIDAYAVKGQIPSMGKGNAYYPGVVGAGNQTSAIFGPSQVHLVGEYEVYLPQANWCPASQAAVPQGAVQFGDDNGPLYFVRALLGGTYFYGVLPANGTGPAYVYQRQKPQNVDHYEVLCQCNCQ